jgi:hypothetical protein
MNLIIAIGKPEVRIANGDSQIHANFLYPHALIRNKEFRVRASRGILFYLEHLATHHP